MGAILLAGYHLLSGGLPETGPSATGIVFFIGPKELLAAAYAFVHPGLFIIPVATGKRSFRAALAGHLEFLRAQLLFPFFLGFLNLFHITKKAMQAQSGPSF